MVLLCNFVLCIFLGHCFRSETFVFTVLAYFYLVMLNPVWIVRVDSLCRRIRLKVLQLTERKLSVFFICWFPGFPTSSIKIDYNDVVSYPMHDYLIKRLLRVHFAAAGFVVGKYAEGSDVLNCLAHHELLTVAERWDFHLFKLAFKSVYCSHWPGLLRSELYVRARSLCSSNERRLCTLHTPATFNFSRPKLSTPCWHH